jgi:outer membrane protein
MGATRVAVSASALAALFLGIHSFGLTKSEAAADTIEWALAQAYQNNPSLNSQRATLRATDEGVPQALSGYRPKLDVTATAGPNYEKATQFFPGIPPSTIAETFFQQTVAATATQTLYNGFQTANKTRQAESQVMAARETLRVTEEQVLLDAATAYMDLLRDQALLQLNQTNVKVLTELLKQTRDRNEQGEVTRTDVSQAQERLALGRLLLFYAQSNYVTSQSHYRQVIGVDAGKLAPGTPVDRFSPATLARAIAQGEAKNPSVLAAAYGVDVAELAVKVSEGALYPTLTLTGSALQGNNPAFELQKETALSLVGQLTVPIYQGGSEYAMIRQSKETVGQQRLTLDVNRDQARATVVQSWGQLDATKAEMVAASVYVSAAELALNGVREEARVGQRTTLDVLNAQQDLLNARTAVVTTEHDRMVASYALLAAVGDLSMQRLGLAVPIYDPQVHYQQVRDAWIGVRIPDGR